MPLHSAVWTEILRRIHFVHVKGKLTLERNFVCFGDPKVLSWLRNMETQSSIVQFLKRELPWETLVRCFDLQLLCVATKVYCSIMK